MSSPVDLPRSLRLPHVLPDPALLYEPKAHALIAVLADLKATLRHPAGDSSATATQPTGDAAQGIGVGGIDQQNGSDGGLSSPAFPPKLAQAVYLSANPSLTLYLLEEGLRSFQHRAHAAALALEDHLTDGTVVNEGLAAFASQAGLKIAEGLKANLKLRHEAIRRAEMADATEATV